jgi:CBS domain-containing protein
MLIAAFLYMAGTTELALIVGKDILRGLKVKDVVRRVRPISDTILVSEAAAQMIKSRVAALPVMSASGVAGVLGINAIRAIPRDKIEATSVSDIFEKAGRILDIDQTLDVALPELSATASGALPVRDGSEIAGVVLASDLAEVLQFKALEQDSISKGKKAA